MTGFKKPINKLYIFKNSMIFLRLCLNKILVGGIRDMSWRGSLAIRWWPMQVQTLWICFKNVRDGILYFISALEFKFSLVSSILLNSLYNLNSLKSSEISFIFQIKITSCICLFLSNVQMCQSAFLCAFVESVMCSRCPRYLAFHIWTTFVFNRDVGSEGRLVINGGLKPERPGVVII